MAIDHDIHKCGAAGGMEEFWFDCQIGEHIGHRQEGALPTASPPSRRRPGKMPK
jgi:hypothetical protein